MKQLNNIVVIFAFVMVLALSSCSPSDGNHTGHEYMPDMGHSIAYEANYYNYYSHNSDSLDTYNKLVQPRTPVAGTIPRGAAKMAIAGSSLSDTWYAENGSTPYYYGSSDSARALAVNDPNLKNISPRSAANLAEGKELYNIYCAICHGEKGDGGGTIVENEKYPSVPPSYLEGDLYENGTDGRFYHAIMQGKGVMGSYADKLSYKERWNVIHHIRSLQAKANDGTYDPLAQTAAFSASTAKKTIGTASNYEVIPDESLVLQNVIFATGSSDLQTISTEELDNLISVLKKYPNVAIQINGHTDNVGEKEANQTLSESRAKSVYNYLVGHGIKGNRLSYKGFGDSNPTATNDTDAGKQKNRRTDFNISGFVKVEKVADAHDDHGSHDEHSEDDGHGEESHDEGGH